MSEIEILLHAWHTRTQTQIHIRIRVKHAITRTYKHTQSHREIHVRKHTVRMYYIHIHTPTVFSLSLNKLNTHTHGYAPHKIQNNERKCIATVYIDTHTQQTRKRQLEMVWKGIRENV